MPVPMHIVTMPYFFLCRRSPCTSVAARIAPVAPSGWPSAIAPPSGLTFARIEPEVLDHRERLRRERLVQLDPVDVVEPEPGLLQHLRDRLDRADAHDLRRHARHREADEAAERRRLNCFIAASLIRITAPAPSDICELLPAVTLPFAANTGRSFASPSGDGVGARAFVGVDRVRALTCDLAVARSGTRSPIA